MAISETNLKLLKAERMTDFADGGGKMTANEVVDGLVNNVFNDISELDRTYGRVSARKVFTLVQTANTDTYLGAHVILTNPPTDPKVNVTLFSTANWTDTRTNARDRIESYSIMGPESNWVLYGDHVAGQRMLRCFSITNAKSLTEPAAVTSPEVGDILVLQQNKAGFVQQMQYVRVTKIVSRVTQQATELLNNTPNTFFKDILIFEIGNALTATYYGAVMTQTTVHGSPTLLKTTSVADAAQYFGVKKVAQNLLLNDTVVKVDSPYSALVPSATAETPVVDVMAGMAKLNMLKSHTTANLTQTASLAGSVGPDYSANLYLGSGIFPTGLTLSIGGTAYKDDGMGGITLANGAPGSYTGLVDYVSGHIQISKISAWAASVTATAIPAVGTNNSANTYSTPISVNNRNLNYVRTLSPAPSPGTVSIDFKALDKWYRLYDDGNGHITGLPGTGSGTINYGTGSVMVTLGALPDIGSAVIYSWASPAVYHIQTTALTPPPPQIKVQLADPKNVQLATLLINWTDNGVSKTASSDAAGTITGDATGHVNPDGWIVFSPTTVPAAGTTFTITNQGQGKLPFSVSPTADPNGVIAFSLPSGGIQPGSIKINVTVSLPGTVGINGTSQSVSRTRTYTDNGAGKMLRPDKTVMNTSVVDYVNGTVTFDCTGSASLTTYEIYVPGSNGAETTFITSYGGTTYSYVTATTSTVNEVFAPGTIVTGTYSLSASTVIPALATVAFTELGIDLTTASAETIVTNSLRFTYAGRTYYDKDGVIYQDLDPLTGTGTIAGSVDYTTGIVSLTNWPVGAGTLTLLSMLTSPNLSACTNVLFRTPGAPLAIGQFQVNATSFDGQAITATADNNGNISSEFIKGNVDWVTGICSLAFGKKVLDSALDPALKAQPWYHAYNVGVDGYIWVPLLVRPQSIKYNCVLISYIPLNADVLGLDTVRLPQDGRVPIFRTGNVVVVHDTETLTLPNPVSAGSTHNCGRTLLSYAKVYDANGLIIPTSKYTPNLDAGTVTFASPLDLTGFVQPLKIEHRIEDMSLLTDVQITGELTLMKPLRHAYNAATAFVSSAMVIGDMQARVSNLFDQQAWQNAFSDAVSGSNAAATFNDTLFPVVVTNAGAIQERWAIVFTGATAFNLYGEYSGLVASGDTGADFSPQNPVTAVPYFHIDFRGWGSGWAAGNVLRFNTIAANYPMWLVRTTLQSNPAVYTDNFKLQIRGDAN